MSRERFTPDDLVAAPHPEGIGGRGVTEADRAATPTRAELVRAVGDAFADLRAHGAVRPHAWALLQSCSARLRAAGEYHDPVDDGSGD